MSPETYELRIQIDLLNQAQASLVKTLAQKLSEIEELQKKLADKCSGACSGASGS